MKKLLICGFILVGCQAVAEPVVNNQPKKLRDFNESRYNEVYISEQDGYRFFIFQRTSSSGESISVILHPDDQIKIHRNRY